MNEKEIRSGVATIWPIFDTDGSGFIEKKEFSEFIIKFKEGEQVDQSTSDLVFTMMDANGDGRIS